MTAQKFLEVRKFQGSTLGDVVSYLTRDLSKALSDLFIIMTQKGATPVFLTVDVTDQDSGATGDVQSMVTLTLEKGRYHIVGTATFDATAAGHTFSTCDAWITINPTTTGTPGDALAGYNRAIIKPAANYASLSCHWFLNLNQKRTVTFQNRLDYSGGAGTTLFNCAMVAHGYVME